MDGLQEKNDPFFFSLQICGKSGEERETARKKHFAIFVLLLVYYCHFSRFSVWGSRPNGQIAAITHEIHNSPYLLYFFFRRSLSRWKVFSSRELSILENIATTSNFECCGYRNEIEKVENSQMNSHWQYRMTKKMKPDELKRWIDSILYATEIFCLPLLHLTIIYYVHIAAFSFPWMRFSIATIVIFDLSSLLHIVYSLNSYYGKMAKHNVAHCLNLPNFRCVIRFALWQNQRFMTLCHQTIFSLHAKESNVNAQDKWRCL